MALSEEANIYEYEAILLGRKKTFVSSFKGSRKNNEREVGNIWRYAVTELLGWTPEEAVKYLTEDIVKQFHLDQTLRGIDCDLKNNYVSDFRFVLQYAFPDRIKYDMRAETIAEYEHVCKIGPWANDTKFYKYPKNFFKLENGSKRARIALEYAINLYMANMNTEQLFGFFSDEKKAKHWLKEKHLDVPLSGIYATPIDYLWATLGKSDICNFYYYSAIINKKIGSFDGPMIFDV